MNRTDVLIAGAGPTGLVLALWLSKLGARVRILDKLAAPSTTSRALAVQARTLELYRQLDLTDAVLRAGHKVAAINLWVRGSAEARVPIASIAADLTPYGPFIYAQDQHERLLIEKLEQRGIAVERQIELVSYREDEGGVTAQLRGPAGHEACQAQFLAGCDGARSAVRTNMGAGFPGGTYQQVFYVADVEAAGPAVNGELHIDLDEADFLAIFPLDATGRARLVGTVRDERATHAESLRFEDVSQRAITHMKIDVQKVNWFSTYRVHHRVTDRFRQGRVFLLGDAAHIHSPAGGQGMNTGIGDAINLAWKLKAVLDGQASDALLDTYQTERRAFAVKLVATTDKAFTLATSESRLAELVRTRLVPLIMPPLFRLDAARHYLFGAVSQIDLDYRMSPLSLGKVGELRGGDRLPWAPAPGADNFETLRTVAWQVHVYGSASQQLTAWCNAHHVQLFAFAWHDVHERAGLAKDALYLVRPDSYIALAQADQQTGSLDDYLAKIGVSLS